MTATLDYSKTYGGANQNMKTGELEVSKITNTGGVVNSQTADTRTGAGAISLTTLKTLIVTNGANALTLANGVEGQEKLLVMKTRVGDGTLTPANFYNGTTITFGAVGQTAYLVFTDGKRAMFGGTAVIA